MNENERATPAADSDRKRKALVRKLGVEFADLQDELEQIYQAIKNLYHRLPGGAERPAELVRLEEQQKRIAKRIQQTTKAFNKLDHQHKSGKPVSIRLLLANARNPKVRNRDIIIQRHRHESSAQICKILDSELGKRNDEPPDGFPASWMRRCGVTTYSRAYMHPKCRRSVQKLIAVAKKRL